MKVEKKAVRSGILKLEKNVQITLDEDMNVPDTRPDVEKIIESRGEVHIDEILESGVQNILLHKDEPNQSDFSIIYNTLQKDPSNSEKKLCCISIVSCVTLIRPMMQVHVKLSTTCSSQKNDMTLVM